MADLQPPKVEVEDSGTTDLESSDDHFSDASEGASHEESSAEVPTTRVERVDGEAAHGETPGTSAYEKRTADAVPDELEIIPEGLDSKSQNVSASEAATNIPTTVVDKVDPDAPSHGEVPNTTAYDMRRADAEPDVVRQAPDVSTNHQLQDHQHSPTDRIPSQDDDRVADKAADDDFDDFAEGDDDDFGAFDDAEAEGDFDEEPEAAEGIAMREALPTPLSFANLESARDIAQAGEEQLKQLFPEAQKGEQTRPVDVNPVFLTDRSQSLWTQLIAPPPLQPPDWVRSRIRRLFLVSLGVPVDLDEILPASKQKKLVLPSIETESLRGSSEGGERGPLGKLKQKNTSSTSVASTGSKSERRRRGPPPPPDFSANAARLLCSTTEVAMLGMTDGELRQHLNQLEAFRQSAVATLEYWLIQKDSAAGDKEAFEEVIENLVKHAKKIRK